ncbi:MAG: reverse transcriptase domain-containing protein [Candidatus Paceibacterota bacterium]|jgi:hypothetical protein
MKYGIDLMTTQFNYWYLPYLMPCFRRYRITDHNPVSNQTKQRIISDPNLSMRWIHHYLIRYIREMRIPMHNATGGRRNNSAFRNVLYHRKYGKIAFNRYFYILDISSAYSTVNIHQLTGILSEFCADISQEDICEFLTMYCFEPDNKGLVTGAPASPDLFNLYCEKLIDGYLRELCTKYNLVYTRYIDDLTFSSTVPIGLKKRKEIRKIIRKAGFEISDRKAKVIDLRKGPTTINGVGICLDGRTFLPRRVLKQIQALIHRALEKGDIKPSIIHGKMSLLKAVTLPGYRTMTESRVFGMYNKYCASIKDSEYTN